MAIFKNISFEAYKALPGINASSLKDFLDSPLKGALNIENPKEATAAMQLGTAIHKYVLEGEKSFNSEYICDGPINPKSGKMYGRDTKKFTDWIAENNITQEIISQSQMNTIIRVAESIKGHEDAMATLMACPGRETAITWVDQRTGLECKALIDFDGSMFAGDLKTASKMGSMRALERAMYDFKYHIQFAFYYDGMIANDLEPQEFRAIFAQTVSPYDVGCFRIGEATLALGREDYELCLDRYIEYKDGVTPHGLFPELEELNVPAWLIRDIDDEEYDFDLSELEAEEA